MIDKLTMWLPLALSLIAGVSALTQIRSNNITNARIKWLENLKQLLSDLLSESITLQLKEGVSKGVDERGMKEKISSSAQAYIDKINESIIEHLKTIEAKHALIKLNLNPEELLHQKLESILDYYMEFFNKIPIHTSTENYNALLRTMGAHSDTLVLLIRYIMKLEWEKTKRSYLSRFWYMHFGSGKRIHKMALSLKLLPERKVQLT